MDGESARHMAARLFNESGCEQAPLAIYRICETSPMPDQFQLSFVDGGDKSVDEANEHAFNSNIAFHFESTLQAN